MERLIILGSNFAGLNLALRLKRKLKDNPIIVIDKRPTTEYYPSMYKIISDPDYEPKLRIDLNHLFNKKGINFINEEVVSIDARNNRVNTKTQEVAYEYLIDCTGAVTNYYNIPGAKENSIGFRSIEDTKEIRRRLETIFDRKDQKIIVVGSGLAGIEVTFEISSYLKKMGLEKSATLTVIEGKDLICPWSNKKVTEHVQKALNTDKINYKLNFQIKEVTEKKIISSTGAEEEFDLLIWCAGLGVNPIIMNSDISHDTNGIIVDEYLRSTSHSNIFAAGDSVSIKMNACPLQKNGHHTLTTGNTVVNNIISLLDSKPLKKFESGNNTPSLIDLSRHGVIMSYKDDIYKHPKLLYTFTKKMIHKYMMWSRNYLL